MPARHHQVEAGSLRIFTLYGTGACHLCEQAGAMLEAEHVGAEAFRVEEVDIGESDSLFERYGLLIPVLKHPDGRELNWPFEPRELRRFLAS